MTKQNLFECDKIERSKDEITPRAGLMLFDAFMKAIKVEDIINRHMPAPDSNRGFEAWVYIRALSLMLYGGGRHISDLRELREDRALQKVLNLNWIPSDSATGDWLLRMGIGEGVKGMEDAHRDICIKMLKMDDNKEYTMWADPTIIDLGDKDYAEMTYTGQKGDRPILVGLKELPIFVYHKYRRGNAIGGVMEAIERGFEIVEAAGKKIKHVALDSEFYSSDVINFLRLKGATFTIVADKDVAVKEAIKRIPESEWRAYYDKEGIKTDKEIAVTVHIMNKTEAISLVVMRWKKVQLNLFEPDAYYYHAIATNMEGDVKEAIQIDRGVDFDWCRVVWKYNERAEMENYLKELKIGLGMEQMPSGEFEANAIYFSIGVLTYNLMVVQKYFVIKEGMENSTIGTIRWRIVQAVGWIARHGNIVKFKIATTIEKVNHYIRMVKRMEAIAALPN